LKDDKIKETVLQLRGIPVIKPTASEHISESNRRQVKRNNFVQAIWRVWRAC